MTIAFLTENVKQPDIKKRNISVWIKTVASSFGKTTGEIAYIFCNDDKILEINKSYLNHDYYTDIITFDYSEDDVISGDIFISLDTVWTNSQKYNTNFQEELHRVIIHGILHLCGIGDKSEGDKQNMREQEDLALKLLKTNQL